MSECPVCGNPVETDVVKCASCGVELHRGCAKRTLGKNYCKRCYREAKRRSRYEMMAQRDSWAR
ncbi:MAG: zinc ribbon domain-containing protein [Candidatus Hadarchaeales archaeon]